MTPDEIEAMCDRIHTKAMNEAYVEWATAKASECAASSFDTHVIAEAMKEGAERWPNATAPRVALSSRIYALAHNLDPDEHMTKCLNGVAKGMTPPQETP